MGDCGAGDGLFRRADGVAVTDEGLFTIFEQDGVAWAVLCHTMPTKDLARETAKLIRESAAVPRSRMRVVTRAELHDIGIRTPSKV